MKPCKARPRWPKILATSMPLGASLWHRAVGLWHKQIQQPLALQLGIKQQFFLHTPLLKNLGRQETANRRKDARVKLACSKVFEDSRPNWRREKRPTKTPPTISTQLHQPARLSDVCKGIASYKRNVQDNKKRPTMSTWVSCAENGNRAGS